MNKKQNKKNEYFVMFKDIEPEFFDGYSDGDDVTHLFEEGTWAPHKVIVHFTNVKMSNGEWYVADAECHFANELHAREWHMNNWEDEFCDDEMWEEHLKEYPGEWKFV